MFEKIRSGAYLKELDDIIEYMIFNNEDKKKFLEMLMYCQGFFRSEMVVETAMAVCISEEIAREMSLPQQKREILHYGTLLHDIGMLSIPRELIETPRKLEPKEAKLVKTHVETAGKILGPRMKKEVVDIVLAHHERCDGSGYPRQLTDSQMSTEQKILQVTDMVVALLHKRSYRKPLPKEKIVAILEEKTSRNVLKRQVVSVVVQSYDKIMSRIGEESAQILRMYETLNKQYELISKKYNI
jgi:HD-GYP domain-containing protein (c-di-GMP phosphodiesterase class II)